MYLFYSQEAQKYHKSTIEIYCHSGKDDTPLSSVDQPFMGICELIFIEKTLNGQQFKKI